MYASKVIREIEVKSGDTTLAATIRKLSWKKLDKAQTIERSGAIATARETGAELVKAFRELNKAEAAGEITPEVKRKARYGQYDKATVLESGLTKLDGADTSDAIAARIEELDMAEAQQIHEAILDLSLPPIDADEAAAVPKGD